MDSDEDYESHLQGFVYTLLLWFFVRTFNEIRNFVIRRSRLCIHILMNRG